MTNPEDNKANNNNHPQKQQQQPPKQKKTQQKQATKWFCSSPVRKLCEKCKSAPAILLISLYKNKNVGT